MWQARTSWWGKENSCYPRKCKTTILLEYDHLYKSGKLLMILKNKKNKSESDKFLGSKNSLGVYISLTLPKYHTIWGRYTNPYKWHHFFMKKHLTAKKKSQVCNWDPPDAQVKKTFPALQEWQTRTSGKVGKLWICVALIFVSCISWVNCVELR